jgi:hypothetical protein
VAIEFLDPDQPLDALEQPVETLGPDAPEHRWLRLSMDRDAVVAAVLLAAAAALTLIAPFQTVWTEVQGSGANANGIGVDGWGRYETLNGAGTRSGVHDPRWGIPLACCAAGFAVTALVVTVLALRGRTPRVASAAAGAALALTGGVAGVTVAMWLQIDALFDRIHSATSAEELTDTFSGIHLGIGATLWLGCAAVVVGVLGSAACLRLRRA